MKFRLKAASGPLTGQTFDLGVDITSLGADPAMDVVIDTLDDQHATIKSVDGGLVIAPIQNSEVYLNGERVDGPAGLSSGDEIRLGELRLVLQAPGLKPQRVLHTTKAKPALPWRWVMAAILAVILATVGYLYVQQPETLNRLIGWPKLMIEHAQPTPQDEPSP